MKVQDLVNLISDERIIIAHSWEYYKNRYTDEVCSFYVDELPDHILAMNVCTVSGYLSDMIQITVFPSRSLMFHTSCCSCYKSIETWLNENKDIVSIWRSEVK